RSFHVALHRCLLASLSFSCLLRRLTSAMICSLCAVEMVLDVEGKFREAFLGPGFGKPCYDLAFVVDNVPEERDTDRRRKLEGVTDHRERGCPHKLLRACRRDVLDHRRTQDLLHMQEHGRIATDRGEEPERIGSVPFLHKVSRMTVKVLETHRG